MYAVTTILDEVLESHTRTSGVVGAAVAVVRHGEVEVATRGVADLTTGAAARPTTAFGIASMTKMLTSTHLMVLVDRGLVDLATPVADVVPEYRPTDPAALRGVTVGRLLTHSSGLPGEFMGSKARGPEALETLVRELSEVPLVHPPGLFGAYCNVAMAVAARVAECVTGLVWEDTLRRDLLEPAGMVDTQLATAEEHREGLAVHHVRDEATGAHRVGRMWFDDRCMAPAGSTVHSSVLDLVCLLRLHMEEGRAPNGTKVLSPNAVQQMQRLSESRFLLGAPDSGWGLGWSLTRIGDARVLMHGGGGVNLMMAFPDQQAALVFCSNSSTGTEAALGVTRDVVTQLLGLEPSAQALPDREELAVDRLVGSYRNASLRVDITASAEGLLASSTLERDDTNLPVFHQRHPRALLQQVGPGRYAWPAGAAGFLVDPSDPEGPARWFLADRVFERTTTT